MAGWSKFSDCPGVYEMHWHTLTSSLVIVRGQLEWLQTHLWVSHRKVMTHSNAVSGDLSSLGFSLLNLCVGKTYCTKESYRYWAPPVFRAKTNKHKGVYILCACVHIYIHTHPLSLYIYIYAIHKIRTYWNLHDHPQFFQLQRWPQPLLHFSINWDGECAGAKICPHMRCLQAYVAFKWKYHYKRKLILGRGIVRLNLPSRGTKTASKCSGLWQPGGILPFKRKIIYFAGAVDGSGHVYQLEGNPDSKGKSHHLMPSTRWEGNFGKLWAGRQYKPHTCSASQIWGWCFFWTWFIWTPRVQHDLNNLHQSSIPLSVFQWYVLRTNN